MDRYTGARGRDPSCFDTRTITLLNRIASNRRVGDQSSHGNHGRPSTSGATGADGRWGAGAQLGVGQLPRAGRRRGGSGDNMDVRPVTPLALLGSLGSDHLPSNMVCVLVLPCNVLLLAVCSPPRPLSSVTWRYGQGIFPRTAYQPARQPAAAPCPKRRWGARQGACVAASNAPASCQRLCGACRVCVRASLLHATLTQPPQTEHTRCRPHWHESGPGYWRKVGSHY